MEYYRVAYRYYLRQAEEHARLGDTRFEKIYHMKAKKALERIGGLHGKDILSI